MAFTHGKSAKFYLVDSGSIERDISAYLNNASLNASADTGETTTLGKSSKTYIGGLKDATVPLEGPRDATAEGYVWGVLGAITTWAYCPEGSASGKVKYSGSGIITSFQPSTSVSDPASFSAELQVTDDVTRTTL